MDSSRIFRGPHESRQAHLLPGVDLELARRQTEHAISMASMQYERQIDEITAIARHREKALRHAQRERRSRPAATACS